MILLGATNSLPAYTGSALYLSNTYYSSSSSSSSSCTGSVQYVSNEYYSNSCQSDGNGGSYIDSIDTCADNILFLLYFYLFIYLINISL